MINNIKKETSVWNESSISIIVERIDILLLPLACLLACLSAMACLIIICQLRSSSNSIVIMAELVRSQCVCVCVSFLKYHRLRIYYFNLVSRNQANNSSSWRQTSLSVRFKSRPERLFVNSRKQDKSQ